MPTDPYPWIDALPSADPNQYLVGGAGRILVVDDEVTIRDLLSQFLSAQGFECHTADSGQSALGEIQQSRFDLVISDIRMPAVTGLELLEHVHEHHPTLPVIMITAVADLETAVDAMKQGAADYITKPFDLKKVVGSVQNALQTRVRRLQDDQLQSRLQDMVQSKSYALDSALRSLNVQRDMTLEALVRALDARESETRCHSLRVQSYALRLARQFDLTGQALEEVARGALLHDIGKIGISDAILLKPGKLTEEEWHEMKKHPSLGYEILRGIDFLDGATELVLRHHERWNGSGYPDGLQGRFIPFGARLFGIVDSYDAMTSDRPYRKALSTDYAREELSRFSGVLYDPEIVEAFLDIHQSELDEISRCCAELIDPA
ncbi:MAG: HD domain-containing phosphohydrolase [Acidobacteriota bacterium]